MALPKYKDIPIDPQYGKPEYFKDWIVLILELIKGIKGTENYFDLTPMTILEIIGDGSNALSLTELTELINRLNSENDATSEELANLALLLDQLSNKIIEMQGDINTILQEINNSIKPDIRDIFEQLIDINNRLDILEDLTKEENVDNNILANKLRLVPVKYIRVRMNGGSYGGLRTEGNYLALLNAYNSKKEKIKTLIVTSSATQDSGFPFNNLVDNSVISLAHFGSGKQWVKIELDNVYDNVEFIEITVKDSEYVNIEGIDISSDNTKWFTVSKASKMTNTDDGRTLFSKPIGRRIYLNDRRAYIDENLDILTDQVISLKNDVTKLKESVLSLEDITKLHGEKIFTLEKNVTRIENQVNTNTENINSLLNKVGTMNISAYNLVKNSLNLLVTNTGYPYLWEYSSVSGCKIWSSNENILPIDNFNCNHKPKDIQIDTLECPISDSTITWDYWIRMPILGEGYKGDNYRVARTMNLVNVSCSLFVKPDYISSENSQVVFGLQCYDENGYSISNSPGIMANSFRYITTDELRSHNWWWKYYELEIPLEIPTTAHLIKFEVYVTNKARIHIALPCATVSNKACAWSPDSLTSSIVSDGRLTFYSSTNPAEQFETKPGDIWFNI